MELENHIVICNWHPYVGDVIRQLSEQAAMEGENSLTVVLLTHDSAEVTLPRLGEHRDETVGEHVLFAVPPKDRASGSDKIQQLVVVEGDPRRESLLTVAAVDKAFAIIIFPDSTSPDPDGPTAMNALTIDRLRGPETESRLIVWCHDPSNVDNFLDSRFNVTDVCSTEWAWRVVCQATRVSHVSNIYRSLMTASSDTNEFYEVRVPAEFPEVRFAELQSIMIDYSRKDCTTVSQDSETQNTLLLVGFISGEDIERKKPHLNPPPDSLISPGDYLLLLTYRLDSGIRQNFLNYLQKRLAGEQDGSGSPA